MAKGFITGLSFLIFGVIPISVFAATLSISPASGTFEAGELVTVKVLVSSDDPLNAVSGTVLFPPSFFSLESVSKAGSIINFWVTEPAFSKALGTVHFEGVTLGGFQGGTGTLVTTTLRAIKAGTGRVSFQSGQVLANDGQGTDITSGMTGATLTFEEAKPKPKAPAKVRESIPEPEPIPKVEEPQPPSTLNPPEIMLGAKYGEPAIIGESEYPKADVLVTFMSENGSKLFITGIADEGGGFTLLVPRALKRGLYNVSAVMVEKDRTSSYPSKEITITIGNFLSDIGWEIKLAIILLIITVAYLLLRIYFYVRKIRKSRATIRREVHEAEDVLHKSFNLLREDVKVHGRERSGVTERGQMSELKKDLDDAESAINKEIKDI